MLLQIILYDQNIMNRNLCILFTCKNRRFNETVETRVYYHSHACIKYTRCYTRADWLKAIHLSFTITVWKQRDFNDRLFYEWLFRLI